MFPLFGLPDVFWCNTFSMSLTVSQIVEVLHSVVVELQLEQSFPLGACCLFSDVFSVRLFRSSALSKAFVWVFAELSPPIWTE